MSTRTILDIHKIPDSVMHVELGLLRRVVGQDRAIQSLLGSVASILSGMRTPHRPAGVFLFMGPTGSGKTRCVEALAETCFNSPKALIKVNCAEYSSGHEVAKLVGAPPGYLGHKDTVAVLSQEAIMQHRTKDYPFTILLFDEIEKANTQLWNLLLGVLDKGEITLGDNKVINLTDCIIVMTSNLGAREMASMDEDSIGFLKKCQANDTKTESEIDQKLYNVGVAAAKKRFSPEFINRIDKLIVFRSLTMDSLSKILDLELRKVQHSIITNTHPNFPKFSLSFTPDAKKFLLEEGLDPKYGARHLKRAIDRFIISAIRNVVGTKQVESGDRVLFDLNPNGSAVVAYKLPQINVKEFTVTS